MPASQRDEIAMSHFESRKIDTQLSFSSSLQLQMELVKGEVMQTPAKKVHTVDVQRNPNLGVNNSVLRPIDWQIFLDQKVPKTNSKFAPESRPRAPKRKAISPPTKF